MRGSIGYPAGVTTKPPSLSRRWLEQRRELHEAYLAVAGNVDVSHLAYLGARRVPYTNAQVAELWAAQATRTYAQPAANHLYVHVPFCKSICSFCNYDRLRPGSADVMARWLDRVVESADPGARHSRARVS